MKSKKLIVAVIVAILVITQGALALNVFAEEQPYVAENEDITENKETALPQEEETIPMLAPAMKAAAPKANAVKPTTSFVNYDAELTLNASGVYDYGKAQEVLDLVNQLRKSKGLNALTMDKYLMDAAMQRAAECSFNFDHTRPDGRYSSTVVSTMSGENIAAGTTTARSTFALWSDSPVHYANMMGDRYSSIGIGCFTSGYMTFWVQVFSTYPAYSVDKRRSVENVNPLVSLNLGPNPGFTLTDRYQESTVWTEVNLSVEFKMKRPNPGWDEIYSYFPADVFTWSSSDTSVATVNQKGVAKAKSAGKTTITAKAKNGKGTAKIQLAVKKQIKDTAVKLSNTIVKHNGSALKPTITVKDGSKTLKAGTDYTVSYNNNKEVGLATVTVTGKGYYTGSVDKKFYITKYLQYAQKQFGVDNSRTIFATTQNKLEKAFADAASKAKANSKYIVYVPAGYYEMTKSLTVPKNVILVGEKTTVFGCYNKIQQFFRIKGAVYGGRYDCNNVVNYGLRFADGSAFDQGKSNEVGNGWIMYAQVYGAAKYGIVAFKKGTEFCYVYKCTISYAKKNGIAALQGAWMAVINGCRITGCGEAGIFAQRSNINIIKNCVIKENIGSGIATDISGTGLSYCKINKIMGNAIINNNGTGVRISEKCRVRDIFSRNTISNNTSGLSVGEGASVSLLAKNTINNGWNNVQVTGKKAKVYLGNSNTFSGASYTGVLLLFGGEMIIEGKNNVISNSKQSGILIQEGSHLRFWGKGNSIKNNKGAGIEVYMNGTAELGYVMFSGNQGGGVVVHYGGNVRHSHTNLRRSKNTDMGSRLIYK